MSTNEEITDWLNRQQEWIREAAHRLLSKGELGSDDVDELATLAKRPEPKLKDKIPRTYPAVGGNSTSTTDLRLESIGPIVGIDALNPKKPLEFGAGNLSVVYGANGSGKSGYTRIISKACGKAHSVDLIPNVYANPPVKRECTFEYSIGDQRKKAVWFANAAPLEDFKPIYVFDTECGRLYLEKDTELSYEPPELTLFTNLVEVCKRVELALTAEQQKLASKLPGIPTQHASTEAGKGYAALTKDTTLAKIVELVSWTEADKVALQNQRERVKIADPARAARLKRAAKVQIDSIRQALQRGVNALGDKAIDAVRRLKAEAEAKRMAAREGARALGDAAKLDGVGTETWKAMWEAARSYSKAEAYPEKEFPHTEDGARCVLCQQHLDESAKHRLDGFEQFVKGTLEQEATTAEDTLKESLEILPNRPLEDALVTSCQAAGLSEELQEAVEASWTKLEPLLTLLRNGKVPEVPPTVDAEVLTLLTQLGELSTMAVRSVEELEADAKAPDRADALLRVTELEGKKWVTEQATAVQAEVDRLNKWADYDEWKRKTATTGISRKAGELSETLITEAYVKRFNVELKKLGAHKIQVELVKTATSFGRSKHGIRLRDATDDKVRVSVVLSEGERRIVALAAFIADVTGRDTKAPFVFDDPISSLDQIFEEKVIARLVELSKNRQVLVFTHRLSFLGVIADKAAKELHCVNIERQPWGSGDPGGVPIYGKGTIGALKKLKEESLTKAKKALADDGYESYTFHAQKLCSDFRKVIERVVENVFLAGVIQRHSREVHTKNVVKNLLRIGPDDCEFIDEMMTEFSKHEHSQSLESPAPLPEPDELEAYLDRMITWHTEFEKRKVT